MYDLNSAMRYSTKHWCLKTLVNLANRFLICQTFPCQCFTNPYIDLTWSSWFNTGFVQTGILKYLRPARSSSSLTTQTLPDPDGPLSEMDPAKAIKLANAEVKQSKELSCGWRPPYLILTPLQHYEVGRQASEHGLTI